MARRQQTKGVCTICEGTFGKQAMTRHLAKCLAGQEQGAGVAQGKHRKTKLFHLVVQGKYASEYWLHLEVPATATLQDLDNYLRNIWLECCGHLSAFTIGASRYDVQPDDDFGFGFEDEDVEGMDVPLGDILRPGMTFTHEYDFGSTTELTLKVVSEREGKSPGQHTIRLLARNEPPLIPCGACGAPAKLIDPENSWEPSGWLCKKCARKKRVSEEMCLPVVNSPRTGVCGYTGDGGDEEE